MEAGQFQALLPRFEGTHVIGVSPDSVKSHAKFANKQGYSMRLLSDTDKVLCQACGVWVEKSLYGKKYWGVARTTFVLDEDGVVLNVWRNVVANGHAQAVLDFLESLNSPSDFDANV